MTLRVIGHRPLGRRPKGPNALWPTGHRPTGLKGQWASGTRLLGLLGLEGPKAQEPWALAKGPKGLGPRANQLFWTFESCVGLRPTHLSSARRVGLAFSLFASAASVSERSKDGPKGHPEAEAYLRFIEGKIAPLGAISLRCPQRCKSFPQRGKISPAAGVVD